MNDTDQESVHDMGTERYALELRAEAINLIAGEKAEREGKSDRLEIGAESATDKVAGGEDLSVGRALIEKANTASTTGLVLNTTVHGHLNANYFTDNIMLTGAMSETYAGALVTVAGMSDVMAAGGGMRVVAGADIRLSGLTGMEEKLFTLMNDGIMIDVFANAFEREFGTAIHNAVTGIISSKVEVLTATTWRPMMKTLVGLRSKNKGSAAGGDESIKSPPEEPPPPAGGEEVAAAGKLLSTGGKSVKRTASPNISLLSNLDSTVKLDEVVTSTDEIAVGLSKPTDDLASSTRGMGYTPATPAIDDLFGKPNTLKRTTSTPNISLLNLLDSTEKLDEVVTNADNGIAFGRSPDIASNLEDLRVADNAADLSDARPRRSDSFLHPDITTLSRYDIPNKPLPGDVDVDGLLTYLRKNANEMGEQISLVKEKIARQEKIEGFTGTGKKRIPKKKTSKKMQLKYETAREEKLEYIQTLNSSLLHKPMLDEAKTLATEYRPHTYDLDTVFRSNIPVSDDYLLWAKEKIKSEKLLLEEFDQSKKLTGYTREHSALYRKYEANNFAIEVIKENKDPIARIQRYKLLHYEMIPIEQLGSIDEVIDTVEDGLVNYVKHSDFQGSNPVRVTDIDGIGNESYLHQSSSVHGDEIPDEIVRSAEADATIRTTENINKEIEADKNKLLKMLEGYRDELHTQFNKKYKSQTGKIEKGSALELEQIRRKRRLALANIIKSIRKGVDPQVALDSDAFKKLDESQAIENFVNNTAELSRRSLEEPVETPPSPLIGRKELHYLSPEDLDLRPSSDYPVPNKRRNTIIMETRDFSPQSRFNVAPAAKTDAALAVVEPLGKSSRKGDFSQIEEGIQSRLQITPDQVQIDETGKIPTQAPAAEINVRKLSQSDAATPILDNGQAQWVKSLPDNIRELEVGAFSKAGDEALSSTRLEGLDDSRRAEISSDPTNGVRAVEPDSTAARAEESSVAEDPVIRNDQQQWTDESKRLQQPGGNSGETRRRSSFQNDRSQKGAPKAIDNTTEALESARTQTAIDRAEFDIQSRYASMRDIIGENHYKYQEKLIDKAFQEEALKLIDPQATNPFNRLEETIGNITDPSKRTIYLEILVKIREDIAKMSKLDNLNSDQIRSLVEDYSQGLLKYQQSEIQKMKSLHGDDPQILAELPQYNGLDWAMKTNDQAMSKINPYSPDPFGELRRSVFDKTVDPKVRDRYQHILNQLGINAQSLPELQPRMIEPINADEAFSPSKGSSSLPTESSARATEVSALESMKPQQIKDGMDDIKKELAKEVREVTNTYGRMSPEFTEIMNSKTKKFEIIKKIDPEAANPFAMLRHGIDDSSINNETRNMYKSILEQMEGRAKSLSETNPQAVENSNVRVLPETNPQAAEIRVADPDSVAARKQESSVAEDSLTQHGQQQGIEESKPVQQPGGKRHGNLFWRRNRKRIIRERLQTAIDSSKFDYREQLGELTYNYLLSHKQYVINVRFQEEALELIDLKATNPFNRLEKAIAVTTEEIKVNIYKKTLEGIKEKLTKMSKLDNLNSEQIKKLISDYKQTDATLHNEKYENLMRHYDGNIQNIQESYAYNKLMDDTSIITYTTGKVKPSSPDPFAGLRQLISSEDANLSARKNYNLILRELEINAQSLLDPRPQVVEPINANRTPPPLLIEADNVNKYNYLDNVSSSSDDLQPALLTRSSEAPPEPGIIGGADGLSTGSVNTTGGRLSPDDFGKADATSRALPADIEDIASENRPWFKRWFNFDGFKKMRKNISKSPAAQTLPPSKPPRSLESFSPTGSSLDLADAEETRQAMDSVGLGDGIGKKSELLSPINSSNQSIPLPPRATPESELKLTQDASEGSLHQIQLDETVSGGSPPSSSRNLDAGRSLDASPINQRWNDLDAHGANSITRQSPEFTNHRPSIVRINMEAPLTDVLGVPLHRESQVVNPTFKTYKELNDDLKHLFPQEMRQLYPQANPSQQDSVLRTKSERQRNVPIDGRTEAQEHLDYVNLFTEAEQEEIARYDKNHA